MNEAGYARLADMVLVVHALYVLFVVGGQLMTLLGWWCGWARTRHFWFRALHLAAVALVVVESWVGLTCPLTALEDFLRRTYAPADGYDVSFVGEWLRRLLFYAAPEWVFALIYTAFAAVVLLTFLFYPPRPYRRPANCGKMG